jgi:hypothetical protein
VGSEIIALIVAGGVLFGVLFVSKKFGIARGPGPGGRRGVASHYTKEGAPKKAYATRKQAMVRARELANKDGAAMNAYRCRQCTKWHVGHER